MSSPVKKVKLMRLNINEISSDTEEDEPPIPAPSSSKNKIDVISSDTEDDQPSVPAPSSSKNKINVISSDTEDDEPSVPIPSPSSSKNKIHDKYVHRKKYECEARVCNETFSSLKERDDHHKKAHNPWTDF